MGDFIDIYCERTGPGAWAEPLNALTNAAFFVAAFFAFRLARRCGAPAGETGLLIALLLAIGTGSALCHTLATGWAMLADTLPILMFQIAFLVVYGLRVMKLPGVKLALLLGAYFFATMIFGALPQHWLNGSVSYFPALLFLGGLGAWHFRARREGPALLMMAALTLAVSLTFRSVDMLICPHFPAGVHFIWHLLNGTVLYMALAALILNFKNKKF